MSRKPCYGQKRANKGAWTVQEDQKLLDYIRIHGEGCWGTLPKQSGLRRCGKSCRLRWINYLRPDVKRGCFAPDEEDLIVKLHALLGNRWSLIAGRLPGRTDNEVKNYWNSHISRKLISKGIDPQNHRLRRIQTMHHPSPPPCEDENVGKPKSSGSKEINAPLSKEAADDDDDQQVSDTASSPDQDETSTCCQRNLDLTIGFPSSSQYHPSIQGPDHKDKRQDMQVDERDQQPTLPLFL